MIAGVLPINFEVLPVVNVPWQKEGKLINAWKREEKVIICSWTCQIWTKERYIGENIRKLANEL